MLDQCDDCKQQHMFENLFMRFMFEGAKYPTSKLNQTSAPGTQNQLLPANTLERDFASKHISEMLDF